MLKIDSGAILHSTILSSCCAHQGGFEYGNVDFSGSVNDCW